MAKGYPSSAWRPVVTGLAERVEVLTDALVGMCHQFAFRTDRGALWAGGLSALEEAFDALGWEDIHDAEEPAP